MELTLEQAFVELCKKYPTAEVHKTIANQFGYERVPVGIDQFLEDEYYLGKLYGNPVPGESRWETRDREIIFERWRHHLREIFPNPFFSPYVDVVFTGGIGIGKTTIADIVVSKDKENLLCLRDPAAKFHLDDITVLVAAVFSVTLKNTKDVALGKLFALFDKSPFFREQRRLAKAENDRRVQEVSELGKTSHVIQTMFPKKIDVDFGSRAGHGLGKAVYAALIDESNFQKGILGQAKDTYTTLKRRVQTRFMEYGSKFPGHFCLVSSRNATDDFLDTYIDQCRDRPDVYIVEFPFWEAKPHIYTGHTFRIYVGDTTADPFIIDESDAILNNTLDDSLLLDVPEEHRQEFEDDIFGALKDLAGKSTNATRKLIIKPKKLQEACHIPIITRQQIISPSLFGNDSILDYVDDSLLYGAPDKEAPHFIHCDFSESGDRTGIGCSHPKGTRTIERLDIGSGERRKFTEAVVRTDFVIFIKARPGEEIPLYKILNFLVELRDVFGWNVVRVTADGFQSLDFRQRAVLQGFEAEKLSVDLKKDHHQTFRTAVNEDRWEGPAHPLLFKELIELRDTGKKFDHPDKDGEGKKGSKDGADGVVGSVSSACSSDYMPHGDVDELIEEMERELGEGEDLPNMLEELLQRD